MNDEEIIKFLSRFGKQSLIAPFKDKNKIEGEKPTPARTLAPSNVIKTFGPMNSEGDFGLFFLVNESGSPTKRLKENIVRARAIWIEDDTTGKKRDDFPLTPNIIVNSSPGKYHYYWLCSTPDLEEHQKVMQTLVDKYSCDPNARDVSRVLRIPGTYHLKGKKKFLVTAEYLLDAQYSWDDIKKAFPPSKKIVKVNQDAKTGKFSKKAAQDKIISSENYHETLRDLAMSYANRGLEREEVADLLRMQMFKVPEKQRDERWASRSSDHHIYECVDSALAKIHSENPDSIDYESVISNDRLTTEFDIQSLKIEKDVLMPQNSVFGEIVRLVYESGYNRNLMSGFLGAAATVAYLGGGKYKMKDSKLKMNLQQVGIGKTGVGKDPIVSSPAELIDACFMDMANSDLHDLLRSNMARAVGSRQGIEDAMRSSVKHDFMLCLDEIGDFISNGINAKSMNSSTDTLNFLLEIYSSGKTYKGRVLAKGKQGTEPVYATLYSPVVILNGASTAEKFSNKLGTGYISHGNAPRIVLQNCDLYYEPAVFERPPVEISPSNVSTVVKTVLRRIADQSVLVSKSKTSLPLPGVRAVSPVEVDISESCKRTLFDFGQYASKKMNTLTGAIWNRAAVNAQMYSMIFAVCENPDEPVIEDWMVENAIRIVNASCDFQDKLFDGSITGESETGKLRDAVVSQLRKVYPKAMSRTQLNDSCSAIKNSKPMERKYIYLELVEENIIEELQYMTPGARKSTTAYRMTKNEFAARPHKVVK